MAKDRVEAGRGRRADVVKKVEGQVQHAVLRRARGGRASSASAPSPTWRAARKTGATTVEPAAVAAGEPQGYLLGKADAPVQVIEFADFECPACAQFATLAEPDVKKRLVEPGHHQLSLLRLPARDAQEHVAGVERRRVRRRAGQVLGDARHAVQPAGRWNAQATSRPKAQFEGYAKAIGLDVDKWEPCYDARKYQARIKANEQMAIKRGASQTPTFIIGGKMVGGAIGYDGSRRWSTRRSRRAGDTASRRAGGDTARSTAVPAKGPGGE